MGLAGQQPAGPSHALSQQAVQQLSSLAAALQSSLQAGMPAKTSTGWGPAHALLSSCRQRALAGVLGSLSSGNGSRASHKSVCRDRPALQSSTARAAGMLRPTSCLRHAGACMVAF